MAILTYSLSIFLGVVLLYSHYPLRASAQLVDGQCEAGCFSPPGNPLATPVPCTAGGVIAQPPTSSLLNAAEAGLCICSVG